MDRFPDTEFEIGAELPQNLPDDVKVKLPYATLCHVFCYVHLIFGLEHLEKYYLLL